MDCASLLGHLSVISSYIYSSYKNFEQLRKRSFANHFLSYRQWYLIFGGHQLSQRAGRLHAQSAVRRLSTLCDALHSVLYLILDSQKTRVNKNYEVLLAQLQGIISGQLSAAIDALKDWSDFAPEDVKKSVQNFEPDNTVEENLVTNLMNWTRKIAT